MVATARFNSQDMLSKCRIFGFLLRPNFISYLENDRAAGLVGNSFPLLSLTFAFYWLLGAPAPLQQSIHPLLQSSPLWWVSCHCLSLQLWTQLPEPDGPISTSSSLSHGAYEGASEPKATADWAWSVEISLRQNNMAGEGERQGKNNNKLNKKKMFTVQLRHVTDRKRCVERFENVSMYPQPD